MEDKVIEVFTKSLFILLTLLFINRFFAYDIKLINFVEKKIGAMADWCRAHSLNLKTTLTSIAAIVFLGMFVNHYADLDNEYLYLIEYELRDLFSGKSWNNVGMFIDSGTKVLIYSVMLISLNRFLKLDIEIVTKVDTLLTDFLDNLILSHGGVFELVSKNFMMLIVAMLVNHHGNIGFVPLSMLTEKSIQVFGLEDVGRSQARNRARNKCKSLNDLLETRIGVLTYAMTKAEITGDYEKAIAYRNKIDSISAEMQVCE